MQLCPLIAVLTQDRSLEPAFDRLLPHLVMPALRGHHCRPKRAGSAPAWVPVPAIRHYRVQAATLWRIHSLDSSGLAASIDP